MVNNNRHKKPVLVLDLDGTLVNSIGDLTAALNVATATVGMAPLPVEIIGPTAGKGARAMIALAHKINNQPLDEAVLEHLTGLFVEHYHENIANLTEVYPGAVEALAKFQENNWLLAICTNKHEYLARKLLEELELNHLFAAICGSDTFDVRKPDGSHILQTIAKARGNAKLSIMVGDTATDINAAKNADIPSIAVDFGYHDLPVETLNADKVISGFHQLWQTVCSLQN